MNTTIQISQDTKEKIKTFGSKGESYDDIVLKLYKVAVKQQLKEFLTEKDTVSIDDAIKRAKKQWQK